MKEIGSPSSTVEELRDYCYSVAGIVGEMLTELYLLDRAELAASAEELRNRAAAFGEGLQLVNILKDAPRDAEEGRVYLPRGVDLRTVLDLTDRALTAAEEYVDLLRQAATAVGADRLQRLHRRAGPFKSPNPGRARPGREAVEGRGRLGRGRGGAGSRSGLHPPRSGSPTPTDIQNPESSYVVSLGDVLTRL